LNVLNPRRCQARLSIGRQVSISTANSTAKSEFDSIRGKFGVSSRCA
jgi:hypothetical protein